MNRPAESELSEPTRAELAESEAPRVVLPLPEKALVLSVPVPVYNEGRTMDVLLRKVLAAPYAKQVIVVDDGSTDGTAEVLKKWEGHPQVEILQHSENCGKGVAIRTGLEHAEGRFTIIQDADLEYDPRDYPALVEPLLAGESHVVHGSRYLGKDGRVSPGGAGKRASVTPVPASLGPAGAKRPPRTADSTTALLA